MGLELYNSVSKTVSKRAGATFVKTNGKYRIKLPGKEYIAVRIRKIKEIDQSGQLLETLGIAHSKRLYGTNRVVCEAL